MARGRTLFLAWKSPKTIMAELRNFKMYFLAVKSDIDEMVVVKSS